MGGTAELDLALDVDHFTAAHAHPRGNARRPAEEMAAERHDREAVDLADLGAIGIDQDDAAVNHFETALADPVGAAVARLDRGAHVFATDGCLPVFAGDVIGLAQKVFDRADTGGDLFAVVGKP